MSLDINLKDPTSTYSTEYSLYETNITHNLGTMAQEAGIYQAIWRPEEIDAVIAEDIISIVEEGLQKLLDDPIFFKKFDASNGWGTYEDFIPFVKKYLEALKNYPKAIINAYR